MPKFCSTVNPLQAGWAPNTNMYLENFHGQLIKQKKNRIFRRMDSLIYMLSEMTKRKVVAQRKLITQNTYSFRETGIRKRHGDAQTGIPQDHITKDDEDHRIWNVKSQSSPDVFHEVQLTAESCAYRTCLKCRTCNVCRHTCQCTCFAYDRGICAGTCSGCSGNVPSNLTLAG